MKKTFLPHVLLAIQALVCLVTNPGIAQQVYDVNADFDKSHNPSQVNMYQGTTPVWSYGWASTLGGFTLYDTRKTIPFLGPSAET
ncbi:MAG: hypothetical protein C4321_10095 [Chloroflexota bacterium]